MPPKDGKDAKLRSFLEFAITSLEPDKVQENFERFLARGKFATESSSAQVVKEAEGLFAALENQDEAFRRMTEAWNGLTNQSQALVNFLRSITNPQPDEELVRQFLDGLQESLVKAVPGETCGVNPVPQYITFQSEGDETYGPVKVNRSAWRYVLDDVCRLMRERHPDTFDRILEIQGFAKSSEVLKNPIEMASVKLYFDYPGNANWYRQVCADVLTKFGYSRNCLTVRVKGGIEGPL